MDSTAQINQRNINNVRFQLAKKMMMCGPYYATQDTGSSVLTDHDTFPYPRNWRGNPYSDTPIVNEREAGYRPRFDNCYKLVEQPQKYPYPDHCFSPACSTIYGCYPKQVAKYTDKEVLDTLMNKACIIEYR
jgi:hypothetical protein